MSEEDPNVSKIELKPDSPLSTHRTLPHYYGDPIRKLFLAAGVVLLVTLPFLHENFSLPGFVSVLLILILVFSAGIMNPKQRWITLVDMLISAFGFTLFAYDAIRKFDHAFDLLFITNLTLAAIFLFSFYLSTKTTRGSDVYIEKAKKEDELRKNAAPGTEANSIAPSSSSEIQPTKPLRTEEDIRRERFLKSEKDNR